MDTFYIFMYGHMQNLGTCLSNIHVNVQLSKHMTLSFRVTCSSGTEKLTHDRALWSNSDYLSISSLYTLRMNLSSNFSKAKKSELVR